MQIDQAQKDRSAALLQTATARKTKEEADISANQAQISDLAAQQVAIEKVKDKNVQDRTFAEKALLNQHMHDQLVPLYESLPDDHAQGPALAAVMLQLLTDGEQMSSVAD